MDDWRQSAGNEFGECYSVFGLTLRSNTPIPGLRTSETDIDENESTDSVVSIRLNGSPVSSFNLAAKPQQLRYETPWLAPSGEPMLRVWTLAEGAMLQLSYFDGMRFWLDREGKNIGAHWPAQSSVEDAATYLLGPVLGLLLRLRGATCLHASAVSIHGRAAAFVGSAGSGKSTTAAALARHGFPVVSDDIVALSESAGGFEVLPSYPYLSLWPEPVSTLYGS